MQPSKLEDRPPYVDFETKAIEDRDASTEQGHWVGVDVDYAIVTPAGSKDRIIRQVDEWLKKLSKDAENGRIPSEWVQGYKRMYSQWKEGKEIPVEGTSILGWPLVSPAQAKMLVSLHIRAVEDLAGLNDEGVGRIGMGGRALKQKAIDWLASAADKGKAAARSASLQAQADDLAQRNESLEAQVKMLVSQVAALQSASGNVPVAGKSQKL